MPDLRFTLEKELFPFVEKPMRYIGNELHCVKKDLNTVSLQGVLCFPDVYDIGMSHYGSQILYFIVNKQPHWSLARCYHPWMDAERLPDELFSFVIVTFDGDSYELTLDLLSILGEDEDYWNELRRVYDLLALIKSQIENGPSDGTQIKIKKDQFHHIINKTYNYESLD